MQSNTGMIIKQITCYSLILSAILPCHTVFSAISTTDATASQVAPTAKTANAPFVLKSGYFNGGSASVSPGCPTGFTAYATLGGGNQTHSGTSRLATISAYCLASFSANTSTINLSINRYAFYSTYSNLTNDDRYMAKWNWAYGAGTSEDFPDTVDISVDFFNNEGSAIDNVTYVIYCYPSSIAPPPLPTC
jgi:hypothetical protein